VEACAALLHDGGCEDPLVGLAQACQQLDAAFQDALCPSGDLGVCLGVGVGVGVGVGGKGSECSFHPFSPADTNDLSQAQTSAPLLGAAKPEPPAPLITRRTICSV